MRYTAVLMSRKLELLRMNKSDGMERKTLSRKGNFRFFVFFWVGDIFGIDLTASDFEKNDNDI
jgi:hypothetical protein